MKPHPVLRAVLVAVPLLSLPVAASAQGLREKVRDLFRFGDCGEPLCLPSLVAAGNVHGNHYVPSAASGHSHYQLFNLADDPFEQKDLASAQPAELRRMMQALIAELERHRAVYPAADDKQPMKPKLP